MGRFKSWTCSDGTILEWNVSRAGPFVCAPGCGTAISGWRVFDRNLSIPAISLDLDVVLYILSGIDFLFYHTVCPPPSLKPLYLPSQLFTPNSLSLMANSRKNVLLFSSREPFFICRLVGRKLFNLLLKHFYLPDS